MDRSAVQTKQSSLPNYDEVLYARNRYNQVPHLTQDKNGKVTNSPVRHHKREPRGQPMPSRWPQGTNKQTRTKHKTEKT